MKLSNLLHAALLLVLAGACKSKPVIIAEDPGPVPSSQTDSASVPSPPMDLHKVQVEDIFSTKRYTYISVIEGDKPFCVALPLDLNIKKGKTYYYKGGLIMANLEKLPFKKEFESVFIVAGVSESPSLSDATSASISDGVPIKDFKMVPLAHVDGEIKLSALFSNSTSYDGKKVIVHGNVVKVNNGIMNRNWIHLQDGTVDSKSQKYDIAITTQGQILIGEEVILEGILALNKDFGAGYKYDLIIENASKK
ncbi:MAG: hypothetical protein ABI761_16565 [Saprospiraceae bacterium]